MNAMKGSSRTRTSERNKILGCLAAALVVAVGCRSIHVHTDWDSAVSFSNLQTFAWLEPPEVEGANPFADNTLLRKRLRYAIELGMAGRGYRLVDTAEEADFLVTYAVLLADRIQGNGSSVFGIGGYGPYYGYGYGYGYGGGYGYSNSSVRNYQESTLIIDVLDSKTRDLLWRGWGSGIVGTRDRDRSDERIQDGIRQILKDFPPDSPDS